MPTQTLPSHPAKFSAPILIEIAQAWDRFYIYPDRQKKHKPRRPRIWDPFGGMGGAQTIDRALKADIFCTEIEWEWAVQAVKPEFMVTADASRPPFRPSTFDGVITSPCYGNRMADHHDAKDPCSQCLGKGCGNNTSRDLCPFDARNKKHKQHIAGCSNCSKCKGSGLSVRNTYKHKLGRDLTPGSAAGLQWGEAYRTLHENVWGEVWLHLRPGGTFILNVKDHIRKGEVVPVSDWHDETICSMPFIKKADIHIPTTGLREGSNHNVRVDGERLLVYKKKKV